MQVPFRKRKRKSNENKNLMTMIVQIIQKRITTFEENFRLIILTLNCNQSNIKNIFFINKYKMFI